MTAFINTIDEMGDDVVLTKLIEHSLTEFKDDVMTTIPTYGFQVQPLKKLVLPSVTVVGNQGFNNCQELEFADFASCVTFGTQAFYYAKALKTVILRSERMCTGGNNVFHDSPIAKGTGYIYVPSACVNSYKSNINWSKLSTQFRAIEDYTVDGTITGELDETKI